MPRYPIDPYWNHRFDKYSRSYPDTKDFHYTKHARHYHINIEWKAALILMVGSGVLVVLAYLTIRPLS